LNEPTSTGVSTVARIQTSREDGSIVKRADGAGGRGTRRSSLTRVDVGAAQAIALEVAYRIRDRDLLAQAQRAAVEQSSYPELVRWRPHTLNQGSAGLAVLFGYLEDSFPGQGWDDEARWHLEAAARAVEASSEVGFSLHGGLSGTAFAASRLSRGGRRYQGLCAALDRALLPAVEATCETLDAMSGGCPVHLFDLIGGLTGAGAYLLCRTDHEGARRALERLLRSIVSLTGDERGLPRWRTPPHLLFPPERAKEFPGGNLNCGLAHGIPGPLGLLSLAKLQGISVPGMEEGIERIVAWLSAHRADDPRGVNFPAWVPLPPPGEQPNLSATLHPSKAAWCYGSPGVCRALYLAGRALAKPAWRRIAVDGMRSAVTRPVEERRLPSPTFCHGVAGLLQITLRFARDTGLPVFAQAARALLAQLVLAHEPGSILGFRSVDTTGARVDDPGLLDGAAGVCLVMLAATTPAEPSWDRLFLLS
jgi:hypothetical protein